MCGESDEACGWPKKTVRAAMAMAIVIPVTMAAITAMLILFIRDQYESALGILAPLMGLSGTIIGYYFGTRSAEAASDMVAKADRELIESKNKEIEMMGRTRAYRGYQEELDV